MKHTLRGKGGGQQPGTTCETRCKNGVNRLTTLRVSTPKVSSSLLLSLRKWRSLGSRPHAPESQVLAHFFLPPSLTPSHPLSMRLSDIPPSPTLSSTPSNPWGRAPCHGVEAWWGLPSMNGPEQGDSLAAAAQHYSEDLLPIPGKPPATP